MGRAIWCLLVAGALWLFCSLPAGAQQGAAFKEAVDLAGVEGYLNSLDEEVRKALPGFQFKELVVKLVRGELHATPADVLYHLASCVFREVMANASLLGKLVLLAIICAVLQALTAAFEKGTAGQLTHAVAYLSLVAMAIGPFALAVQVGREAVDKMVGFMQALLPIMLTLLVALGNMTSAALFHPVIIVGVTFIGTLIKNVALPLIFLAAVLTLAGHLSPQFKVSNLAGLLRTATLWVLGMSGTVFLGLLAVQGVAGAVGDGLALRVAKFSLDAFVPIVGRMFSDALEAVVSTSLLIKNALGVAGMLAAGAIIIAPMLKLISLAFIFKLAGALIQPVGDAQVADCLSDLGNSVMVVFAAVATLGLLFFFALAILIGVGNLTVMLR
ncbi:stage III sporulation protein AE [Desulfovirgula thermocuniculi]|uniref:stage III sporulation protein AE n=1 Tax=Desulfovirgula thermocuniculi TaxID=348842 RepID=UPI0003F5C5A0|nr:stage III sporulation protein AE [Desulfovirgula thermocuniculi]